MNGKTAVAGFKALVRPMAMYQLLVQPLLFLGRLGPFITQSPSYGYLYDFRNAPQWRQRWDDRYLRDGRDGLRR